MTIQTITKEYEDTLVVDTETGEVLAVIKNTKTKPKIPPMDKYIGIETPYPKDCKTADQLVDVLSIIDAYINTKVSIYDSFLVENALSGYLTMQQQVFLRHLAAKVQGWNYLYTNTEELTSFGVDKKSLSRTLSTLEDKQFLRVLHKDFPYKGQMILLLNPYLCWKGDKRYQSLHKNLWYQVREGID